MNNLLLSLNDQNIVVIYMILYVNVRAVLMND